MTIKEYTGKESFAVGDQIWDRENEDDVARYLVVKKSGYFDVYEMKMPPQLWKASIVLIYVGNQEDEAVDVLRFNMKQSHDNF